MKVIRRIFGNIDTHEKKMILEHAFGCKMDGGYFNKDLDEKSEEYTKIKKLVHSLDLQDAVIGSEFTKEETEQAEVLVFKGTWSSGYPEPQDPILAQTNTYLANCSECGVHGKQKAPFQIREPKLGKHKLMELNWVFDELFAEREFYEEFFKNIGIEKQEVMLYKKNMPVKSVVQLIIPVASFKLDMKDREFSTCPVCNKVKYTPVDSDFFPVPPNKEFTMIKTQESFGSSHSASRRILVSNEVMTKMIKAKVSKYYQFVPTG